MCTHFGSCLPKSCTEISRPSLIPISAVVRRNSVQFSADNCRKCAPQFLIFSDTNFGSSLPKSCTNFGRQVPKLSTDVNLTFFTFSQLLPNFRRPYLLNRNSVFHQILTRCTWTSILSSTKILWKTGVGKTIVRLSGQRRTWHAFQENRS